MKIFIYALLLFLLSGCSAIDISQYDKNTPTLDLFTYFSGDTKGWGIVQDRKGRLTRQFTVEMKGVQPRPGELVLYEDFVWSDGELSKRTWKITQKGNKLFGGTAEDVEGEAFGQSSGNALNWNYYLNLVVDGTTWKIHFDDWMFLQQDNVLINRATMSKFGFRLGEVTIVFLKQDNGRSP